MALSEFMTQRRFVCFISIKVEFGYDDRKGVGACDRGPSGWGRRGRPTEEADGAV